MNNHNNTNPHFSRPKFFLFFLCSSAIPPLFLRTKLGETPIRNGIITDFAPSLHRLWYGGRAELQRNYSEGKQESRLSHFENRRMISPAIKTTDVPMIIISQSIMPIGSTLKNAGTRFMIAICPRKIIAAIPRNPLHPFSRKAECPVEKARALKRFQNWKRTKVQKTRPLPPPSPVGREPEGNNRPTKEGVPILR